MEIGTAEEQTGEQTQSASETEQCLLRSLALSEAPWGINSMPQNSEARDSPLAFLPPPPSKQNVNNGNAHCLALS